RSTRSWNRPDAAASRADGEPPFRNSREGVGQRRSLAQCRGARERGGDGAAAVVGSDPPAVADAAEGAAGRRGRSGPARGRGDGASPTDPCRRYARPSLAPRKTERGGRRRCGGVVGTGGKGFSPDRTRS